MKERANGLHYLDSKHMAFWHWQIYEVQNKTMHRLIECYNKRVRKQQVKASEVPESIEEEVPESIGAPEEEQLRCSPPALDRTPERGLHAIDLT
ncbi:hypothetical protein DMENIID0001_004520 [Sergentomyia squamirostris]